MLPAVRRQSKKSGFTTMELIVVIAVAGILSAMAVAKFVGREGFESRGFQDRATAVVRYAQKTAIAQRRTVFVVVTPDRIAACYDAGCAARVLMAGEFGFTAGMASALAKCGGDRNWLCAGTPDGVALTAVTFSFDGLGRPSGAANIALPGSPASQIVVAAETGYVHH